MKNVFITIVVLSMLLASCSAVDYFTRPENQRELFNMGVTCFSGPDLKAGAAYIIRKNGMSVEPTTSGEFLIGCDGKWFTVICDFTKGPNDEPCSNVQRYDMVPFDSPVDGDADIDVDGDMDTIDGDVESVESSDMVSPMVEDNILALDYK